MSAEARSKHASNMPSQRLLSEDAERVIDAIWRNRWRALLAVDDLVEALVDAVAKQDLLAETYFCFTSDHGFRLGQHNIMIGKRHPHDVDTRIQLVVRGPGIRPGSTIDASSRTWTWHRRLRTWPGCPCGTSGTAGPCGRSSSARTSRGATQYQSSTGFWNREVKCVGCASASRQRPERRLCRGHCWGHRSGLRGRLLPRRTRSE